MTSVGWLAGAPWSRPRGAPTWSARPSRRPRAGGQLSLTSAALHHGWPVKTVPDLPHVTVPRWRKVSGRRRAHVHWTDHPGDGIATSEELTLEQCLRTLPFDEALAIADSAIADGLRGPGSPQVRGFAALASPRAANPFESVLRAHAPQVPGLSVRPDPVDERLRSTSRTCSRN